MLMDYHMPAPFKPQKLLPSMRKRHVTVFMMSADDNLRITSECLRDSPATDFFVKPLSRRAVQSPASHAASEEQKQAEARAEGKMKSIRGVDASSFENCKWEEVDLERFRRNEFHILIIDDNPFDADCVMVTCREININATYARSEKDALVYIDKRKPDLILMDYYIPDFDAIKFLSQLREMKFAVIVMSGDANKNLIKLCLEGGVANEFFIKPVWA